MVEGGECIQSLPIDDCCLYKSSGHVSVLVPYTPIRVSIVCGCQVSSVLPPPLVLSSFLFSLATLSCSALLDLNLNCTLLCSASIYSSHLHQMSKMSLLLTLPLSLLVQSSNSFSFYFHLFCIYYHHF